MTEVASAGDRCTAPSCPARAHACTKMSRLGKQVPIRMHAGGEDIMHTLTHIMLMERTFGPGVAIMALGNLFQHTHMHDKLQECNGSMLRIPTNLSWTENYY